MKNHLIITTAKAAGICLGLLGGATAAGYFFRHLSFPETNIVIVYILAVLLSARLTDGFAFGVIESVLATFTFNYFFTSPYFSFNVDNPNYIITFFIMTVTAIITSAVTSRARINAREASEREAEATALFKLTSRLAAAQDIEEIASVAGDSVSRLLKCRAGFCPVQEDGTLEGHFLQQAEQGGIWRDIRPERGLHERLQNTEYVDGRKFRDFPVKGGGVIQGVIRVPLEHPDNKVAMNPGQLKMLYSMSETIGLAMDRLRAMEQRILDHEMIEKERDRANLLRSISHDLRTPLAGIMGTSEMLMDMTRTQDPRMAMLKDIYMDADWLHSLVENILSLTRLQDGRLVLHKEPEACEEVIDAALQHIRKRAPDREIEVEVPDEFLVAPMDGRLIGQVIINLVDNAVKHTHKEDMIKLRVSVQGAAAVFEVADSGSGISEEDMPYIFQLFYTANGEHTDKKRGMGIGLSICEAIVKAHGGSIRAENRREGGAVFTFSLPLSGDKTERGKKEYVQ